MFASFSKGSAAAAPRPGYATSRDALLWAVIVVLAVALAAVAGLTRALAAWADQHPAWLVDTLIAGLAVTGVGLTVLTRRRLGLVRVEIAQQATEVARQQLEVARCADFLAAASDWFWEMDTSGRWTMASEDAPEPIRALVDATTPWRPDPGLVADEAWTRFTADVMRRRPVRGFRFSTRTPDGTLRHFRISGVPARDAGGDWVGYRGTGTEVTDQVASVDRAEHLSEHDLLTGLPNRAALRARLDQALLQARRSGVDTALLCLDVDGFGEINDGFGEQLGDRLIHDLAERLAACLGAADLLARIGPDQLAVLRQGTGPSDDAGALGERLLATLAAPFDLDGTAVAVTACLGIVAVAPECDGADDLLRQVDIALRSAKADGRGSWRLYDPAMEAAWRAERATEDRLRRAMAQGEFELHYEPLFDVERGGPTGVEALLCWRHPERGLLLPQEFLADLEALGLTVPLGAWVLETGCREVARWPGIRLSVNLSPAQFWHPGLVATVQSALAASGLAPQRLELEITERALLRDSEAASLVLDRLKDLTVKVAVDDFGTGYARLGQLRRFDKIKLDQALIDSLERRSDGHAVVGALVELGRSLGMRISAEGVETEEQGACLRELGCAELQGFLFGRPLEADELAGVVTGGHLSGHVAGDQPTS